jgi:hypothetical protein
MYIIYKGQKQETLHKIWFKFSAVMLTIFLYFSSLTGKLLLNYT